jgi:hypothetical protein
VIDGTASAGDNARLHSLISPGAGIGATQRVEIYRDSSRRAREKALEAIYPVCRQVVGHRCFAGLAADFMNARPSRSGDLNVYGGDFPQHLQTHVDLRGSFAGLPYLSDLARLEWHWHAVYYAPDDPAFDVPGFTALTVAGHAEDAWFHLSAALRLFASDYPVREIWRRHRETRDTASVPVGAREYSVIHRDQFRPEIDAVEPRTFRLLDAVSKGRSLAELAADELPVEQIPHLIASGWVTDFSTSGEP